MSARTPHVRLLAIVLAITGCLPLAAAPAAAAGWTDIARIPGTVGLVDPMGATAPDGTDLALWREGAGAPLSVQLRARVRLPGSTRWRDMGIGPKGTFLQDMVVAPTPGGDFWIAYQVGVGGPGAQVRLTRLDTGRRTWSKPVRLFASQTAYDHAGAGIAIGGDGTLVVTAYARPLEQPAGDPAYRTAVTIRRPGGPWRSRFLSEAGAFSLPAAVDLNDDGDTVVAFSVGYAQADSTVWAGTLRNRAGATWKIRRVSGIGDGYRPAAAIGDDGTAAVVWTALPTTFAGLKMATMDVDLALEPWVGRDVVDATPAALYPHVVVADDGQVTIAWLQGGATSTIWTRHLGPAGLNDATRLTPTDELASLATHDALQLRPDGKVALLYQRFDATPSSLGLRFRVIDHGVPGSERTVTGDVAADGPAQTASLGIDRRGRATVVFQRGTYPDTDIAWVDQAP